MSLRGTTLVAAVQDNVAPMLLLPRPSQRSERLRARPWTRWAAPAARMELRHSERPGREKRRQG